MKLNKTLRENSADIDAEDVLSVKNVLAKAGYYDIPDYGLTPYPDRHMFDAIKLFQRQNSLMVNPHFSVQ